MSTRRVKIDELSSAIMDTMQSYANDVTEEMKKDIDDVAKEATKMVKSNAPVRDSTKDRKSRGGKKYSPGSYKKSWTNKVVEENSHRKNRTIYSKGQYQLAHLLEKGHKLVLPTGKKGTQVQPIVHIRPAEEWAVDELKRRTIRRIQNNGV